MTTTADAFRFLSLAACRARGAVLGLADAADHLATQASKEAETVEVLALAIPGAGAPVPADPDQEGAAGAYAYYLRSCLESRLALEDHAHHLRGLAQGARGDAYEARGIAELIPAYVLASPARVSEEVPAPLPEPPESAAIAAPVEEAAAAHVANGFNTLPEPVRDRVEEAIAALVPDPACTGAGCPDPLEEESAAVANPPEAPPVRPAVVPLPEASEEGLSTPPSEVLTQQEIDSLASVVGVGRAMGAAPEGRTKPAKRKPRAKKGT